MIELPPRAAAVRVLARSETIINLIIQLIAGVVGGNAAGSALKNVSLGGAGNTIAAIGGIGGGQLLQVLIPALADGAAGNLDWVRSSVNWSEAEPAVQS